MLAEQDAERSSQAAASPFLTLCEGSGSNGAVHQVPQRYNARHGLLKPLRAAGGMLPVLANTFPVVS